MEGTYHPKPGNVGCSTHPFSQFSYLLFLHTCCDHGSTTASHPCPIHSRYMTGNLWKILLVWNWIPYGGWMLAWAWPDSNESWTCGRCSGVMWPMNCFGRSRCHLIYTTQEIRDHRTGQPINLKVWKPETHTNCSSLFVVFNYKSIPVACQFCFGVNLQITGPNLPSKTRKSRILHTSIQSLLILTFSPHLLWSWIHYCIPDACPIHSRNMTGNLWKILLVWNWIPYGGWMLEHGRIPMKAELVEGVVVLCGRWTVLAEAGVT